MINKFEIIGMIGGAISAWLVMRTNFNIGISMMLMIISCILMVYGHEMED